MEPIINHSFGVLVYKDSPYLSACLDSLTTQTVRSKIFISTSTPSEYIETTAKKYNIPVYINEEGKGIAHDWNFCMQKAETKYLTLAHQDDIYLQGYTENCLAKAEKYQDVLICFTDYSELVNEKERSSTILLIIKKLILYFFMPIKKNIKSKFIKKRFLSFGSPIAAPSVLYNLKKIKNFSFSNEFTVNMDWDAWYKMSLMQGRFVYVNKKLMQHRIHEDSATTKGIESESRKKEDLIMFKRFWNKSVAHFIAKKYMRSYEGNH